MKSPGSAGSLVRQVDIDNMISAEGLAQKWGFRIQLYTLFVLNKSFYNMAVVYIFS